MVLIMLIALVLCYPALYTRFNPYDIKSGKINWFAMFMWILWLILLEFNIALIANQ